MQRRKAREEAFKLLFEAQFYPEKDSDALLGDFYARTGFERDLYIDDLIQHALSMEQEMERIISLYAIGWKKERFSKVSYAILLLAVCEIEHRADVPVRVTANEAVELSKEYESGDAPGFLNGILGSFIRAEGEKFPKEENRSPEKEEPAGEDARSDREEEAKKEES